MGFAARTALLCVLALATLGSTAPDAHLPRLLERMRAAAGPVWQTHFVSISRLTIGGHPTVVSSDSEGLHLTVRRCTGELCDGTYFDGNRLYSIDLNGTALPQSSRPEPYLRALRLVAMLGFLAPSFGSSGGQIADGGPASLGGKRYATMVVLDRNALGLRLYVDPQTALVRYARDVNGTDTFEYRAYRRIDGFMLPFEVLHNGKVLERYDDRTPVATAFHPPHGPVPVVSGHRQPIALDPTSATPIFDCRLDGVPVRCLLDTGNSGLSVSSELASRLSAPVVGTFDVHGLGSYATQVVRAGPLRIGNATYPPAYYVVLGDLRRYGYDVVLGADLLGEGSVEIDPAAHLLRFDPPIASNAITVPLSFENFVPVVDIRLGTLDAKLAVDTGDESNINLGYDFYARHASLFNAMQRRPVSGIGGSSIELIGEIPHVTIGNYRTGPQRIGATQLLHGTAFGHLGAAFLGQFKADFDYAAGELRLVPQP